MNDDHSWGTTLFILAVSVVIGVVYLAHEDRREKNCESQNGLYLRHERKCVIGKEIRLP